MMSPEVYTSQEIAARHYTAAHTRTCTQANVSRNTLMHSNIHTAMTVVLVAFKGLMEGSKKTLMHLFCVRVQQGPTGEKAGKGDPQALSLYSNVDSYTDLFYWL